MWRLIRAALRAVRDNPDATWLLTQALELLPKIAEPQERRGALLMFKREVEIRAKVRGFDGAMRRGW